MMNNVSLGFSVFSFQFSALLAIVAILVALAYVTYLFVSRRASPIPYFPSNKKDLPLIVKALRLQSDQVVWDLGAGDGIVVFEAARESHLKKLNTQFVAVEINPVLIMIMYIRRLFHPNHHNIHIVRANIFTMQFSHFHIFTFSHFHTFFTYISPWYMEQTVANIARQYDSFPHVSYFYKAPKSKAYQAKLLHHTKQVHKTFSYCVTNTTGDE